MHNENVGADRNATALMCTVNMLPGFFVRTIQLDFYVRQLTMQVRRIGGGPLATLFWGYSKEALEGLPNLTGGFNTISPDDAPQQRFFWRDDEGPPYIWIANSFVGGPIGVPNLRVHFEYFPTRKRQGSQPMAGAGSRDFPSIVEATAIIQPGV
jgi:hypothetical protein